MYQSRILRAVLYVVLTVVPATAQVRYPVKWAEKPVLRALPDSLKKQAAVFILEEKVLEMEEGKEEYELFRTVHHLIRLNDDKGVEAFNTFTIPYARGNTLTGVKARTILPSGKTIEVGEDKIKEVKSEDGTPEYRIAMEGVEPGAEVELIYTEQRSPSSFHTEVYQFGVPILQGVFRLIVPEKLRYDLRGYNGFPDPKDSVADNRHFYTALRADIPDIDDEPYSRYRAALMRVDYKLSYINSADNEKSNVRRLTWSDLAKQLHNTYDVNTEKEQRVAEKFLRVIGVKPDDGELQKLLAIEDYFKANVTMSANLTDEDAVAFSHIADKKLTTEKGYMRFFTACLSAAGVAHEVGLLDGRFSYPMDETLEMWDALDLYTIYLPKLKAYIAPTAVTFRYPFIPYMMCGARGVFTKTTTLGSMTTALPDIRTVPHTSMAQSHSNVSADVTFDEKSLMPVVKLSHTMLGYNGEGLRETFLFAPPDRQKEMVQTMSYIADKVTDIQSYNVENTAYSSFTTAKPLTVNAVIAAPSLMEKAGPKYLFKAGTLIGRQSELYHDDKRTLPIETGYPNEQIRTLRIAVPAGYKVANPEAVRLNVQYAISGTPVCGFASDYTMEGTTLVVNIREFYAQTSYPLAGYESYRKVINAAADFNKVVLVLQKI